MHRIDHNADPIVWGPKKYEKTVVCSIDSELHEELVSYCRKRRISLSAFLRYQIADLLAKDSED